MAIIDFIGGITELEGTSLYERRIDILEENLDEALEREEQKKDAANTSNHLVADLQIWLTSRPGIRDHFERMFQDLVDRKEVPTDKLESIRTRLDTWIVRNETRIALLKQL